jgi:IMP dehydrogenase
MFSEHIKLNIPLVSANMDTVTGARMAIALAKHGGIGVIHRYLTIEEQAEKILNVKREEGFILSNPHSVSPDDTIGQARLIIEKNNVGSLVVIDSSGNFCGMLTTRDVRFCRDTMTVYGRMTPLDKLVTASPGTSLEKAKKLLDGHRLEKLPLVKRGKLFGLITARDIDNLEKYPLANKDIKGQLVVAAAVGATGDFIERSSELLKAGADAIVIDIANGQSIVMEKAVRAFRKHFPSAELVCGNVVLPSYVRELESMGVNGIKIGLGPGRACTTRKHTNIGVPQLMAVYECRRIAKIPINADGGIRKDGDMATALIVGGADTLMLGNKFAGTDESPGVVFVDEKTLGKYKMFRGMASREAMYNKFIAEFKDDPYETTMRINPEGLELRIHYKGPVAPVIAEMAGHLASTISYMGARTLKEAKEMFRKEPRKFLIGPLSPASHHESFDR